MHFHIENRARAYKHVSNEIVINLGIDIYHRYNILLLLLSLHPCTDVNLENPFFIITFTAMEENRKTPKALKYREMDKNIFLIENLIESGVGFVCNM